MFRRVVETENLNTKNRQAQCLPEWRVLDAWMEVEQVLWISDSCAL
jgi:hypothetical protein